MHTVRINGTEQPCFGLVRGGRGIVLANGILLMEPVCTHDGSTEFPWPETLPSEIRRRDFYPWRREACSRLELFGMREPYRHHVRAKLLGLEQREKEVCATTLREFMRAYGTEDPATVVERFLRWHRGEIEAIAQLRKPYQRGFDFSGKHYEYTLRRFAAEHGDRYREARWYSERTVAEREAFVEAILGLNLRLESHRCGPAGHAGWDVRCKLIDMIRSEAVYGETIIYLQELRSAPHDTSSISLLNLNQHATIPVLVFGAQTHSSGSPTPPVTSIDESSPSRKESTGVPNECLCPSAVVTGINTSGAPLPDIVTGGACDSDRTADAACGVSNKLDAVGERIDVVSRKIDELSTAVEGAKAAASDAGRIASEVKVATETTGTAVMSRLIPEYETLKKVQESKLIEAAKAVLREIPVPEVDRYIIEAYYGRNLSQDKIVSELRKQRRGKSKHYVGKVINDFNCRLKAKGVRAKEKVTGPPLPPECGFDDTEGAVPRSNETPASIVAEMDPNIAEVEATIDTWRRADQMGKQELETHYAWLARELESAGLKPTTAPK